MLKKKTLNVAFVSLSDVHKTIIPHCILRLCVPECLYTLYLLFCKYNFFFNKFV